MNYKKSDFLTPFSYARKYKLEKALVLSAMVFAYKNKENVKIFSTKRPLVLKKSSTYYLRPEPVAQERFIEIINTIKEKQK